MSVYLVTTAQTTYESYTVIADSEDEAMVKALAGKAVGSSPAGDNDDEAAIDVVLVKP